MHPSEQWKSIQRNLNAISDFELRKTTMVIDQISEVAKKHVIETLKAQQALLSTFEMDSYEEALLPIINARHTLIDHLSNSVQKVQLNQIADGISEIVESLEPLNKRVISDAISLRLQILADQLEGLSPKEDYADLPSGLVVHAAKRSNGTVKVSWDQLIVIFIAIFNVLLTFYLNESTTQQFSEMITELKQQNELQEQVIIIQREEINILNEQNDLKQTQIEQYNEMTETLSEFVEYTKEVLPVDKGAVESKEKGN
ncbi:hypothetical protein M3202_18565 [Alkalihalobacillus oceani]|uniref:Uncharacterized protein n=1 Tax=Halalkalibacter oceani TaxID=1653776 RepID=A0A9X2IPI1_9BACI|nr:hypothetical protein [Halalkalibacter oceani]MCM3716059.1 hypothetical protein [Halalkalibacter oceani]